MSCCNLLQRLGLMKSARLCASFYSIVLICIFSTMISFAQEPSLSRPSTAVPAKQKGIVLLRNGQIISGEYSETGSSYIITLGTGGVIRLQKDQIEFVSDSIDEIYSYRRASTVNNSADAHLAMANWCLTNRLYDYAQFHLQQSIRINPRHPAIIPIQARVAIARSAGKSTVSKPSSVRAQLVSNETIAARLNQLDPGVIQSYVGRLQPLLINTCAVAGCHGVNTQSAYQLIDFRWTRKPPRNVSYRNLYNSMKYVDFSDPQKSVLLSKATTAHGSSKKPAITITDSEQLSLLVDWVRILTSPANTKQRTTTQNISGPIVFQTTPMKNPRRVSLPETSNSIDRVSKSFSDPVSTPNLNDTSLSHQMLKDEKFAEISLSKDFDDLPFSPGDSQLLRVFSPPSPQRHNLTPTLDSLFPLPSDQMLKRSNKQAK